jgi:hypothetical protein
MDHGEVDWMAVELDWRCYFMFWFLFNLSNGINKTKYWWMRRFLLIMRK